MKKTTLILAMATLALVSCKKDYACECTTKITNSSLGYSSENKTSETINKKMSKKTATASCDNTKSIVEKQVKGTLQSGFDAEVSCTLK